MGRAKRAHEGLYWECMVCHRMRARGWFTWKGQARVRRDGTRGTRTPSWACRECRKPHSAALALKRRALMAAQPQASALEIRALWHAQRGLCGICGTSMFHARAHLDHKIPVSRGGSGAIENLQWVHARCNLVKAARMV